MIECNYCKKWFEPSTYQLRQYKANKAVYCSKGCATASRYGNSGVVTQEIIENIKTLFKTTDMSYDDIQKVSKLSKPLFATTVKKYNLGRSIEQSNKLRVQHMKDTMQEKYGITNAMELQEFRDSSRNALLNRSTEQKQLSNLKRKQTKLEKYDDANYHNINKTTKTLQERYNVTSGFNLNSVIEKRKKTSMEKYGVENPFNVAEVRALGKAKIKEKYGVDNALASPIIRDKINKAIKEKYGVDNIMQLEEYKSKYNQSMYEKYGVTSGFLTENAINSHKCGTKSKINNQFVAELKTITSKSVVQEKSVIKYIYDILIGDAILIDINPTISHNTYISYPYKLGLVKDNIPVDKNYHMHRLETAVANNYTLISIFDWDDWDKIKYMLQDKETLYARNLEIKEIPKKDTDEFLNKYHLQNTCQGQKIRIGLYKGDELIEVMTFGKPRYNKNYEWELLRLCTKAEYMVVGGAERLFKYFTATYKPKSIISYCDLSKFSGEVYTRLGFKQKGEPKPSKHWSKGSEHITDNLLRQRGYDQLFNTNYGKGTSNEELMLGSGWLPIYDCGQLTFVWKNKRYNKS